MKGKKAQRPKGRRAEGPKGERGEGPKGVTGWFNYKARQVDPDIADLIKKKKKINSSFDFIFKEGENG